MKQLASVIADETTISQFATVIEDIKPLTQPSIIVEGGLQQIGLVRLKPENVEKFLLMHPLVARGIEIRANRMTSRGYVIKSANKSQQAKRAAVEMQTLIADSGGVTFVNSWIRNGYGFGNSYLTLVPNVKDNKIVLLHQEHPIFFRIARHKLTVDEQKKKAMNLYLTGPETTDNFYYGYGTNKIDPQTKKPAAYTQVVYDPTRQYVVPIGPELLPEQVAHLVFDTWGDEVDGLSVIQYIHMLINYLLNIEEAAAETTYRNGFTQKKITTEIMTERDLKEISKNIKDINSKDAIILPKGVDLVNLIPGQTQFPEIHEKFMTLIAIRLGIPKPILTLDGSSTNKATMDELTKDMMDDLQADELKVKATIENQIFKSACKKLFGDNFSQFPTFDFNPYQESEDARAARNFRVSQTLDALGRSITALSLLGYDKRAEQILKFIDRVIPEKETQGLQEDVTEQAEIRNKPAQATPGGTPPKASSEGTQVGRPDGTDVANVRGQKSKPLATIPAV